MCMTVQALANQRKPQARAAVLVRGRRIDLVELIEQELMSLGDISDGVSPSLTLEWCKMKRVNCEQLLPRTRKRQRYDVFFQILEYLKAKTPKALILENGRGLVTLKNGKYYNC